MSWLREDDNETDHPKVLALIAAVGYEGYYRLHRLRGYCARHRTNGRFSREAAAEMGLKPRHLAALLETKLIEEDDGKYVVHDWDEFNPKDPTKASRQAKWRAKRNGHVDTDVDGRVDDDVDDENVSGDGLRARAHARVTSRPVLKNTDLETNTVSRSAPDDTLEPTAQTLTAEYVDACHAHEIETPRRLIGQIAQATGQLLTEGVDPNKIRAGYRRMVTRGIVQPSLLPNFVAEASIPSELTRPPNAGLTGDQITEIGRRMSQ